MLVYAAESGRLESSVNFNEQNLTTSFDQLNVVSWTVGTSAAKVCIWGLELKILEAIKPKRRRNKNVTE